MSPGLPLEDLGETPREKRLLGRIGVVVAALLVGAGAGASAAAWASTRSTAARVEEVDTRVDAVTASLAEHLTDTKAKRPQMEAFVSDMKAAVAATNAKLDLLLEDCYRRGGCKR